jgi:translation initiation factor IF-1
LYHHEARRVYQANAVVTKILAASNFRCELIEGGHELLARCCFKMSAAKVMLSIGDQVLVEIPDCGEGNRARILYRYA